MSQQSPPPPPPQKKRKKKKEKKVSRLVLQLSCAIYWSQVLSREWRCRWSSADRRCSDYSWVINNYIAYVKDCTVARNGSTRRWHRKWPLRGNLGTNVYDNRMVITDFYSYLKHGVGVGMGDSWCRSYSQETGILFLFPCCGYDISSNCI